MMYHGFNLGRFVEQIHKLSSIFGCDQIYKYFGHTVLLFKSNVDVQQPPVSFYFLQGQFCILPSLELRIASKCDYHYY
jgi:hypothetical protein